MGDGGGSYGPRRRRSRNRKEARPKITENLAVSLEEEEHQAGSPMAGDGQAALVEDSAMEQEGEVSDFAKPSDPDKDYGFEQYSYGGGEGYWPRRRRTRNRKEARPKM